MDIDKTYDRLLAQLEAWTESLATQGPEAVDSVRDRMHEYLEGLMDAEYDAVKVSLKEKLLQVKNQLTEELGKEPSDEVIASEMNLPGGVDTVRAVLKL